MKNPTPEVSSRYGAPMGRRGAKGDPECGSKWILRRIPINNGGYDAGGAYWGLGAPLYWAECGGEEMFFRARNRDAAKAKIREDYPEARFYR